MRRLGRRVDDEIRALVLEHVAHCLPVTNIQGAVPIGGEGGEEFFHHRPCRPLRTKKLCPHVVVNPYDFPALTAEHARAFRTNESSRARNECFHLLSSTLAMCRC